MNVKEDENCIIKFEIYRCLVGRRTMDVGQCPRQRSYAPEPGIRSILFSSQTKSRGWGLWLICDSKNRVNQESFPEEKIHFCLLKISVYERTLTRLRRNQNISEWIHCFNNMLWTHSTRKILKIICPKWNTPVFWKSKSHDTIFSKM